MASRKVKDLSVKIGEYTNKAGELKSEYLNIGSIMESDNGQYILLNRTFNPAGVPNPKVSDSVLVSIFEPRTKTLAPNSLGAGASNPVNAGFDDMPDDVPF